MAAVTTIMGTFVALLLMVEVAPYAQRSANERVHQPLLRLRLLDRGSLVAFFYQLVSTRRPRPAHVQRLLPTSETTELTRSS